MLRKHVVCPVLVPRHQAAPVDGREVPVEGRDVAAVEGREGGLMSALARAACRAATSSALFLELKREARERLWRNLGRVEAADTYLPEMPGSVGRWATLRGISVGAASRPWWPSPSSAAWYILQGAPGSRVDWEGWSYTEL